MTILKGLFFTISSKMVAINLTALEIFRGSNIFPWQKVKVSKRDKIIIPFCSEPFEFSISLVSFSIAWQTLLLNSLEDWLSGSCKVNLEFANQGGNLISARHEGAIITLLINAALVTFMLPNDRNDWGRALISSINGMWHAISVWSMLSKNLFLGPPLVSSSLSNCRCP